jgi:hypothetical protein
MFRTGILLFSLLAVLAATPLSASVAIPADLGALAANAQAIVHGRVVNLQGRHSGDGLGIETLVTLEVQSYLKGDLGKELTFVVLGGHLGRYRSVVSGAPQFLQGEEVVLFLGATPPALPFILKMNQGAFRVSIDRRTGARTILRQPLAGQAASWQKVQRGTGAPDGLSLQAFGTMVRTALENGR